MNDIDRAAQHLRESLLGKPSERWVNFWCGAAVGMSFVLACDVLAIWLLLRIGD